MSDDERRARALPIFGGGKLADDIDPRDDAHSAGSVFKLLFRAWPFLDRYISGKWAVLTLFGKKAEPPGANDGYLWSPVLFTYVAWMANNADSLSLSPSLPDGALFWGKLAQILLAVMGVCAWGAWGASGRLQVAAGVIGLLCGFMANFIYIAALKVGGGTALTLFLIYIGGWFVRLYVANGSAAIALRTQSHVIYYNAIVFSSRFINTLIGAFTVGLLVQNVFLGIPPTPALAFLIGQSELAAGTVSSLTVADRQTLLMSYLFVSILTFFITRFALLLVLPYYATWIQQRINQDLRLALVERWHRLSMRYHADHRVGDSVYRIYQDSAQVTSVISRLVVFATQAFGLASAIFLLTFFDWRLAAAAAILVVPMVLWAGWFSPRMRTRSLRARQTNSDLTSRIQEIFAGLRVIKAYGREREEQDRFENDSVTAFNAAYRARSLIALATIVSFCLVAMFLLPGEYFMAIWANQQKAVAATVLMGLIGLSFTIWNAATFSWVKDQFFTAATDTRSFSREWALAQDTAMGLNRVFDILDIEPDVQDAPDAIAMPPFSREVAFSDVAFAYAADRPILIGVTFKAKADTITAIVGPTGAGKSTMMALMLRLFDPDSGAVTIDGRDLRDLQVESLRDNVSIALQENILFGMSVADNIRYVAPQASLDEVREAARIACADEFISELPEGYDTLLGDRGGKLSTGQRQRLSIARALMKNAPILLLDEPTAALDAET
ncbi:MAG TPA: ABC transporter ATP-binding protein, partial [Caulobacterales bacterium]|nr:ABC transporter ATP-binding protein [Caulobacterales bacterium]